MKILAIYGSPRGQKSQTRRLTEKVLDAAKAQGAQGEVVDLCMAKIKFCLACEKCHQGPKCVFNDDTRRILDGMLAANGIILASPVYINQVTAQMKAVLDRSSHFIHCLRLMGKYVAAVTTSGSGHGAEVQEYLKHYALVVGAQFVGGVDAKVPLQEADFTAAGRLGESLVAAIREKRRFADQIKIIDERKQYFGQLINRRQNDWTYEYNYWRQQRWL